MRDARTGVLPVLAAGLVLVGGVGCGVGEGVSREFELGPHDGHDLSGEEVDRLSVGDMAPDFTLNSYSGDVITLSEYRGEKVVLLVFYRGHW